MSATSIPSLAGRVLLVGLDGPELTAPSERRLRALDPAGVTLFDRNLESPRQTRTLLAAITAGLTHPPLLALDQEGGRVSRLRRWIGETPTAVDLAAGDPDRVRQFARATGSAMRSLGFNVDFAPVVDLCPPTASNGIGIRSFGTDPEQVTRLAGEFLAGLRAAGLAGCLKHFPGLGDSVVDSHVELPTVRRSREQLEREDLLPYRRLISEADSVMVGHGYYPALDPAPPRPATCSRRIVHDLLRSEFGFAGLVITDDLEMGAVTGFDRDGAGAVQALRAGCDLLLYCSDLDRAESAAKALIAEARRDAEFHTRLADAARRVDEMARRWPVQPAGVAEWDQARRALERFTPQA